MRAGDPPRGHDHQHGLAFRIHPWLSEMSPHWIPMEAVGAKPAASGSYSAPLTGWTG